MLKSGLKRFLAGWPWLRATLRRLKGPPIRSCSADRPGCVQLFPGFDVRTEDTLVDVGCGPGQPCLLAGSIGADVIAIDIDPVAVNQVERAMRSVPARSFRAFVSDSDPLPLPDALATVVMAQEVMEHVDHPERFLAELVRIGKPGARYFLSVPDPASEKVMRSVVPPSYFQKPGHQHVFGHEELDGLVRSAGLTLEQRIPFGFYWSVWWALLWSTGPIYAPGSDLPYPDILSHWDIVWQQLQTTPSGPRLVQSLEHVLPKSQVLIARKPVG